MSYDAGTAYVSVRGDLRPFAKDVKDYFRGDGADLEKYGADAGKKFSSGFKDSAGAELAKPIKPKVEPVVDSKPAKTELDKLAKPLKPKVQPVVDKPALGKTKEDIGKGLGTTKAPVDPVVDQAKLKAQAAEMRLAFTKLRDDLDVNDKAGLAGLSAFNAKLAAVEHRAGVKIVPNLDAAKAVAEAHALDAELDRLRKTVKVKVTVDKSALSKVKSALFAFNGGNSANGKGTSLAGSLTKGAGPELPLIGAPLGSVGGVAGIAAASVGVDTLLEEVTALGSGFAAAGAGAGAFAILAKPAFSKVSDAYSTITKDQKAYDDALTKTSRNTALARLKQAIAGLNPDEAGAVNGIHKLAVEYHSMSTAFEPQAFKVFNDGLKIAGVLLPKITPFANTFATSIDGLLKQTDKFAQSKGFSSWLAQFQALEGPSIAAIGAGIGKVVPEVGKLLTIFSAKDDVNAINIAFTVLDGTIKGLGFTIDHTRSAFDYLVGGAREWESGLASLSAESVTAGKFITDAFLNAAKGVVHGAADAFGWIPGLGGKLKQADAALGGFKASVDSSFDSAKQSVLSWKTTLDNAPKVAKLQGNIDDLKSKISAARKELADPHLTATKKATLKADIGQLSLNIAIAQQKIDSLQGKTVTVTTLFNTVGSNVRPGVSSPAAMKAAGFAHYASGTQDALAGWALVGENGPELVGFKGGETVKTAAQTRAATAAAKKAATAAAKAAAARKKALATAAKDREKLGLSLTGTLAKQLGSATTASAVTSGIGKVLTDIKTAWSQGLIKLGKDKSLTAFVNAQSKQLQALATRRGKITDRISTARQAAASTASSITGDHGIVAASALDANGNTPTVGTVIGNLGTYLKSIKLFNADVQKLGKAGLNKAYLEELIAAGPDAGLPIAQTLLGATKSQIGQLNKTEFGISEAAGAIGKQGADLMYDSGAAAGKGYLTGLESQEKAVEKEAAKLASITVKTVRKELGIKSPSTVMREHGGQVPAGFALGMDDGLDEVRAAASRTALASVPRVRMPVRGGDGGAVTARLVYNGPASGPVQAIMRDMQVEIGGRFGGNVQAALSGRGR